MKIHQFNAIGCKATIDFDPAAGTLVNRHTGQTMTVRQIEQVKHIVSDTIHTTEGTSTRRGMVGRALVGGVLLGALGALLGAIGTSSTTRSTTTTAVSATFEVIFADGDNVLLHGDQRGYLDLVAVVNRINRPWAVIEAEERAESAANMRRSCWVIAAIVLAYCVVNYHS